VCVWVSQVWWDGDSCYFKGTIINANKNGHVKIRYDDKQVKWHPLWLERFNFIDHLAPLPQNAATLPRNFTSIAIADDDSDDDVTLSTKAVAMSKSPVDTVAGAERVDSANEVAGGSAARSTHAAGAASAAFPSGAQSGANGTAAKLPTAAAASSASVVSSAPSAPAPPVAPVAPAVRHDGGAASCSGVVNAAGGSATAVAPRSTAGAGSAAAAGVLLSSVARAMLDFEETVPFEAVTDHFRVCFRKTERSADSPADLPRLCTCTLMCWLRRTGWAQEMAARCGAL
jgi:hypothetical protein